MVLEPELAKYLARFVRHAQIQPYRIERHEADQIPEYAKAVDNHDPSVSLQQAPFKRKLRGSEVNWIFRCGDGRVRLICGKGADRLRRIGSGNGPTREGWPSGLRRTPGKRVGVKAPPGFESPSLRHFATLKHAIMCQNPWLSLGFCAFALSVELHCKPQHASTNCGLVCRLE